MKHGLEWREAVGGLDLGKRVGGAVYMHVDAVPEDLQGVVSGASALAEATRDDFCVVKFGLERPVLSLLEYPSFDEEAFPCLRRVWTVDLEAESVRARAYADGANRPVLHRKELLLSCSDPRHAQFSRLTRAAEELGLFENTGAIGFSWQWEEELRARGVAVEGHAFVPRTSDHDAGFQRVARHRTALRRNRLSSPMQALWRHGLLDGDCTVFDYGCGRGDDLDALAESGIDATGWDPYFRPDSEKRRSDVVNLGFVLNVIEDPRERREALAGAWSLTGKVLAVAALVGGRTAYERLRLMGDGVLTSRGTFQKYFAQGELGSYIADVVGREPIAVAPGVFFVFRTDTDEQGFLERKQRSAHASRALPASTRTRTATSARRRSRRSDRWILNQELIEDFWRACLSLARMPEDGEYERLDELAEKVARPRKVLAHLLETRGGAALEEAQGRRREDLLVYFALNLFGRRRSFGALESRLQKDVRTLFGSYTRALSEARQLLFSIGRPDAIEEAAGVAAGEGVGFLEVGQFLQFESGLANQLPALLRVYLGAGEQLFGDVGSADLVKIHLKSGKLSLMTYDDFEGRAIPLLVERVKINLRRQRVDYFSYGGEHAPQPLYLKSRYMDRTAEGYARQSELDESLLELGTFDFSDFGPSAPEFEAGLSELGLAVQGFELVDQRTQSRSGGVDPLPRTGDRFRTSRRGGAPLVVDG